MLACTLSRAKVYDELLSLFETASGGPQGYSVWLFMFNLMNVMYNSLGVLQDLDAELQNGEKF